MKKAHLLVGFALSLNQISAQVQEAKQAQATPDVTALIETVRAPGERKPRIDAVRDLTELFPSQSFIDRERIVDALLAATEDNDKAFRHFPVAAAGRLAELGDEPTAEKIARDLGQKIEDRRIASPWIEAGERADLLVSYARTAGRAHIVASRHPDQFLEGVRLEAEQSDARGKTLAFRALNLFLSRGASRIYFERREMFAKVAEDLLPMTPDAQIDARAEFVKVLVFLSPRRGVRIDEPGLRQRLHDKLENLYSNETDPSLRYYLRLHLGH